MSEIILNNFKAPLFKEFKMDSNGTLLIDQIIQSRYAARAF